MYENDVLLKLLFWQNGNKFKCIMMNKNNGEIEFNLHNTSTHNIILLYIFGVGNPLVLQPKPNYTLRVRQARRGRKEIHNNYRIWFVIRTTGEVKHTRNTTENEWVSVEWDILTAVCRIIDEHQTVVDDHLQSIVGRQSKVVGGHR